MAAKSLSTPFKTHLSFFSHPPTGLITLPSALRASLALGLNFPVSCLLSVGLPLLYGNTGFLSSQVNIEGVKVERPQLQSLGDPMGRAYSKGELLEQVKRDSWVDWGHVLMFWNLSADERGMVSADDVRGFQKGTVCYALAERRKSRDDVVPFSRGGPFSYV